MSETAPTEKDQLIEALAKQSELQQQLINALKKQGELQQQLIDAQKQIIAMTPKNAPDKEIHWHIASGMYSKDAANSNDLETVKRFEAWNIEFAEKFIKPYVNPRVYSECLGQMVRGLPGRIAELQTRRELELLKHGIRPSSFDPTPPTASVADAEAKAVDATPKPTATDDDTPNTTTDGDSSKAVQLVLMQ